MKQTTIISRGLLAVLVAALSCMASKADKMEIDNISAPKGAKLIINEEHVYLGDLGVSKHPEGYIELISRDSNIPQTRSRAAKDKRLAVKGRTWWYEAIQPVTSNKVEFGVRIGDEVTINDEIWNKVELCMYTPEHPSDTEIIPTIANVKIGYIKDDGKIVTVSSKYEMYNTENVPEVINQYPIPLRDSQLYCFEEAGVSFIRGPENDPEAPVYTIQDIETITNSGYSYLLYHSYDTKYPESQCNYIEGIGDPTYYAFTWELGGVTSITRWDAPKLTYVTEGDDNHIIYTAKGGVKLWELAGVEDVTVDGSSADAPVEYYNLQGQRITAPASGTTVIRRQGTTVSKVLIP